MIRRVETIEFKPYNYQKECIDKVINYSQYLLLLDMGLGKTIITLTALQTLRARNQIKRVLVIAPKKVAEDTWLSEADKWDHTKGMDIAKCLGTQRQRMQALDKESFITVTSRDNFYWLVQYQKNFKSWPFDMIVIDELTSFKNHASKRFKALKQVLPHTPRRLGLTGTPAPKGLHDLWAQVYFADEGRRLGKYITHFRANYFTQDAWNQYVYKPIPNALEIITEKISDISSSMKADDYIDMPETIYNNVKIKLDKKTRTEYNKFEKTFCFDVGDDEDITASTAAALSNKLLQLCNGAVYKDDGGYTLVHDMKIEALSNIIEDSQGQPILVFYSFKSDKERIIAKFGKSLRIGDLREDGTTQKWNAGEYDMLLAHPASAAFGLNLQQGGHIIVYFGLQWGLELYLQSIARLRRQGQTHTVIVHHLVVEDSLDEDVMMRLSEREVTQEGILEALKARIRRINNV